MEMIITIFHTGLSDFFFFFFFRVYTSVPRRESAIGYETGLIGLFAGLQAFENGHGEPLPDPIKRPMCRYDIYCTNY